MYEQCRLIWVQYNNKFGERSNTNFWKWNDFSAYPGNIEFALCHLCLLPSPLLWRLVIWPLTPEHPTSNIPPIPYHFFTPTPFYLFFVHLLAPAIDPFAPPSFAVSWAPRHLTRRRLHCPTGLRLLCCARANPCSWGGTWLRPDYVGCLLISIIQSSLNHFF